MQAMIDTAITRGVSQIVFTSVNRREPPSPRLRLRHVTLG
jgi:hypothetical protein